MPIAEFTTIFVASTIALCAPPAASNHVWLSGDFNVKVVSKRHQDEITKSIDNNNIKEIDATTAREITEDTKLSSKYYYTAKIAYFGNGRAPSSFPSGLALSVDVDDRKIAYVTSYRLTSEREPAEISVVLTSQIPLNGVQSICGAAE